MQWVFSEEMGEKISERERKKLNTKKDNRKHSKFKFYKFECCRNSHLEKT